MSRSQPCNRQRVYAIYPEDFHEFGELFFTRMADILQTDATRQQLMSTGTFHVVVLAEMMGQSLEVDERFAEQFERLDKFFLEEVIYHIAYDLSKSRNFILWSRSALKGKLPNLKQEYYAGGFGGHGNFYFEPEDNQVKQVKFYSELFKNIHRSNPVPFKGSPVSEVLFGKAMGSILYYGSGWNQQIGHVKRNCEMMKNVIDSISTLKTFYGRMEAIVNIKDVELMNTTLREIFDKVDNFVNMKSLLCPSSYNSGKIR
jgi:hypothetical protein